MLHCVITTIQTPTSSVVGLAERLTNGERIVIAGDTKGPPHFDLSVVSEFADEQLVFLPYEAQASTGFELAKLLPTKHYSRKNLGYLQAIRDGASCIYETDDDNAPLPSWSPRAEHVQSAVGLKSTAADEPAWVNVYRHFSDENIWPRGIPLDQIHTGFSQTEAELSGTSDESGIWAPIQQGLADGSPDVDAIWRLVLDHEFEFDRSASVILPSGQWCPFNTQSTWWWPAVYPLLYIPSFCTFRMCDIWKSFVAQRCLWTLGAGVAFHAPEVVQERNVHNLMRDFTDEIPGYKENNRIAEILNGVSLKEGLGSVSENLMTCYQALVENQIFPEDEVPLLECWLKDLSTACQ